MTTKNMTKKNAKEERTLRLKRPCWRTLGLALVILAAALALAELALRSDFIRSRLPAPSIASGHRRFDLKLALLDNLVKEAGRLDCIFLGGSDVNAAINPEVFGSVYKSITGKDIVSINFGIDGLTLPAAALLARILVEKYHPRLLIWGLEPAVLSNQPRRRIENILSTNPWCRYRLGDFTFEGWLTEHSYAYRYFLRFRIWLERPGYSKSLSDREGRTSKYGYTKIKAIAPFSPKQERETRLKEMLSDFTIGANATTALERMMRLRPQVEILIVEIPCHPSFFSFYGQGIRDHDKAISHISRRARHHGILFIPTSRLNLIPEEGFRNSNHMNIKGARIFSRWLGVQIGEAVKKGLIKPEENPGLASAHLEEKK